MKPKQSRVYRKTSLNFFERRKLERIVQDHTSEALTEKFGIARETIHRALAGESIHVGTRAVIEKIFEEYDA
jgi:hypothetical protein